MSKHSEKNRKLAFLGILIALEIVFAFTSIGYIKVGLIEITLMPLIVALGVCSMGVSGGIVTGLVFGVTSFLYALFGMSPAFGTPLISMSVINTFILLVAPRFLMGFLVGLFFTTFKKYAKQTKVAKNLNYIMTSFLCVLLNTVFFITFLMLLFGNSELVSQMVAGRSILTFIAATFALNALVEATVTTILGPAIMYPVDKILAKNKK